MAPKQGEPHEKIVNGRNYYWCPNHQKHGMWATHKPAECSMKNGKSNREKENKNKRKSAPKPTYNLNNLKPTAKYNSTLSIIKKLSWADLIDSDDDSDFQ